MKAVLLADGYVGFEITQWMLKNYQTDILAVCVTSENEIARIVKRNNIPLFITKNNEELSVILKEHQNVYIGLSLWWPFLLSPEVINYIPLGIVNTHPGLLPFGRGKHPNFWSIVEKTPFGVTLHLINKGIDSGPVLLQKEIKVSWDDTGESLYKKATHEIINLFIDNYHLIRVGQIRTTEQNILNGTFHVSSEILEKSHLDLSEPMKVSDLLNLLRAKTCQGHSGCWFVDDGVKYEVSVLIRRIDCDGK
ncbi:formyltransferase family protein [Aeromonas salmonicida]|uniref:formyltransferase family protein n=1 Tax=Aeromonas salmonicida TaxID=645 RepID=UPI003D21AF5D